MKMIIDTSPLVIHMAGTYKKDMVNKVSLYNAPNKELICMERLISAAAEIYITPYVFAESFWLASSRLGKSKVVSVFENYKEMLLRFKDAVINKAEILNSERLEFGPADVSLFLSARKLNYPILTSDTALIGFCRKNNVKVINFAEQVFSQC